MEGGEDGMRNIWDQGSWQKGGNWRMNEGNNVMIISLHDGRTSRILRWFIIFRAYHYKDFGLMQHRESVAIGPKMVAIILLLQLFLG
jgi:hypothetical protein